jgi:moderate conductance mechanosensitive channel
MTTNTTLLAISTAQRWHDFWRGEIGAWIITRGLRIVMLFIAAVLAVRFVTWVAQQVTRQLDEGFAESDALVRSEATKHRQAVASVIQWVSIVIIAIWVIMQIADVLQFSVGGLIAPATVLGAALGFGAQQLVKDLLSGFFIIVEKQYGFGDLVSLTVTGIAAEARGTVEDVTLRVTRLRSSEGELFTIPNGQIVKTVNLSKDWARAVIDIPVSTSADLNRVNEVLHQECEPRARQSGAGGVAPRRAHRDGDRKHWNRHRHPARGGPHAARQAVRGGPAVAGARPPGTRPRGIDRGRRDGRRH